MNPTKSKRNSPYSNNEKYNCLDIKSKQYDNENKVISE